MQNVASFVFGFHAVGSKVVGTVAGCHSYKGLHIVDAVFGEDAVLLGELLAMGFSFNYVQSHEGAGAGQTFCTCN